MIKDSPRWRQSKQDAAVDAIAGIDFSLFGAGHNVAGGQFHHVGGIFLHEAVAVFVQQVGAFTTGRF